MMLTNRQQEILEFIKGYVRKHAYSPTHDEIKKALNITSCSYLNRMLDKFEDLEIIKRKPGRKRHNIELLQPPYSLPLIGKIAAGLPIEAINQPAEIVLTEKLVGENRYLLEVKGDSMIEDNICDGDLVICERCQTAPNGTIVVALINQQEATLKRIYYEENKICLKPANKNHKNQYYQPEEVEIQGQFIGLIRLNSI